MVEFPSLAGGQWINSKGTDLRANSLAELRKAIEVSIGTEE
jgi:hypothetical protein